MMYANTNNDDEVIICDIYDILTIYILHDT